MTKTRKFSFIIFGLLFAIAGCLFVGCASPDYSNTSLVCLYENKEITSLDIMVGEEKYVDFQILNPASKMNASLYEPEFSTPGKVSMEEVLNKDYTTQYKIKGLLGGQTVLTMSTQDGKKEAKITINVKQYTSTLTATSEGLFVTKQQKFTPSSNHFSFSDNTTEKLLKYYFYGEKVGNSILDHNGLKVSPTEQTLSNEFKSVSLVYPENKGVSYLLFEDSQGNKFSLSKTPTIDTTTGNKHYSFVAISRVEELSGYNACKSVTTGEEFYFVGVYEGKEGEEILSCERKFRIFEDILISDIVSYAYEQVDVSGTEEKVDENITAYDYENQMDFSGGQTSSRLTLVPSFTTKITSSLQRRYNVAYLKITARTNSLMEVKIQAEDTSLLSGEICKRVKDDSNGTTDYYIKLSSSSSQNASTFYNVTFYYKGYETSNSSSVNLTQKIPVDITIVPQRLLVNNQDASLSRLYTFYNRYEENRFGWQEFRFAVDPSDARVGKLQIGLSQSNDLQFKYKGKEYSYLSSLGGSVSGQVTDKYLEISDIDEPVYIKGIDGSEISEEKYLHVSLCFSLFGQDEEKPFVIPYKILKGAENLILDESYADTLYIDINGEDRVEANGILKADASFVKATIEWVSGDKVVLDSEGVCEANAGLFDLKFSLEHRNMLGEGIYRIKLDNGVSKQLKIVAIEGLKSVSTTTSDAENNVRGRVANGDEGNGVTYYVENDTLSSKDKFDIQIIANEQSQTAISSFEIIKDELSLVLSLSSVNYANKTFDILLSGGNGVEDIQLNVKGYKVVNFAREEEYLTYNIHVVSFSYIESLKLQKLVEAGNDSVSGQEGANNEVYYNAQNEHLRTVTFTTTIGNDNAFLFNAKDEEGELSWLEEKFQFRYISWEYNKNIYYFDEENPIIETRYGYFNMKTLSYTAKKSGEYSLSITETLIARVVQYGKNYSYSINVRFKKYIEVSGVTLISPVSEISISSLKTQESVVAFATNNKEANNPTLIGYFKNNSININDKNYSMFEVTTTESDGKFMFTITANPEFSKVAIDSTLPLKAKFYIIAQDWLVDGNLDESKLGQETCIDVGYENGTEANRYTLSSEQDFLRFDLKAHYKIASTIDISSISNILPLGDFSGSIVGKNEYAQISGINITDQNLTSNRFYGLFSSLSYNAYIDNVIFAGKIEIGNISTAKDIQDISIGLVAGVNNGTLRNIAVKLSPSIVYAYSGNIGGVVGINNGKILQDYSFTSLSNKDVTPFKSYKTVSSIEKLDVTGCTGVDLLGNLTSGIINLGGVSGQNQGTIQKVDAKSDTSFIGYTNYFAYVNLSAIKHRTSLGTDSVYSTTQFIVGGITGDNKGSIIGCVATYDSPSATIKFTQYERYSKTISSYYDQTIEDVSFQAGKGLIVGGQINADGYESAKQNFGFDGKTKKFIGDCVGGIAGLTNKINSNFTGLTSRIFLRSDGNVSGIANDPASASTGVDAFSLQAVENGETGKDASMIVIDRRYLQLISSSATSETIFGDISITYEKIAFGEYTNAAVEFFTGTELETLAFKTFLTRTRLGEEAEEGNLQGTSKDVYNGDYIILGKEDSSTQNKIKYKYFEKDESKISVSYGIGNEKLNNNMKYGDQPNQNNAYYAYYFDLSTLAEGININQVQNSLDSNFNIMTINHEFYPISAIGELSLTSLNPEIVNIDRDGKMTIKRTGVAKISATSILNKENQLVIYIYVVNYFNSILDTSIIYPTQSAESTKVENSEISIIANNRVSVFILPDYSYAKENSPLLLDKNGEGKMHNVAISLKANDEVGARVEISQGDEIKNNVINHEIVGNEIIFSKGSAVQEGVNYGVKITPMIQFKDSAENVYVSQVNKQLTSVQAKYKKGAIRVSLTRYDEATISTSTEIRDNIVLSTTANKEEEGIDVEIFDAQSNTLIQKVEWNKINTVGLFDVSVKYTTQEMINNINYIEYSLKISINTQSNEFINRLENNIYKEYRFVFNSCTNSGVKFVFPVTLEKTSVSAISVTNYNKNNLSSSSEIINLGEQGYLALSIAPVDGEFDYILVENEGATAGQTSGSFGISAKKLADGMFEDNFIIGSRTANGIKLTRQEIEDFYSKSEYQSFNGEVYINYIFGTDNVEDGQTFTIAVSVYKNGESIKVRKPLTGKLPYYAKVTIGDKVLENGHFAVARGLEYKLNIQTYGYDKDLLDITLSNEELGSIEKRNGEYYLCISSDKVSYANGANQFNINLATSEGQLLDSKVVQIQEYVLTYDGLKNVDKDIVQGMGEGVINVQIGSGLQFEIDLYDFVEYDGENVEIVSKVQLFMDSMVKQGYWLVKTNLDEQGGIPSGNALGTSGTYSTRLSTMQVENYYFKYSNYKLTPIKTHEPIEKGYEISYAGKFEVDNSTGVYKALASEEYGQDLQYNLVQTRFMLNVYTSSSDQSPIPIFEYKDLLKMQKDGYYILLNNIVVPNTQTVIEQTGEIIPAFAPLTQKFKSLDGNGLSIIFNKGKYDVGSASRIALFEGLNSGSVIKNLTVSYQSSDTSANLRENGIGASANFSPELTYFTTTSSAFTFGGIVCDNSGSITNCKVETLNGSYVSVYAPNAMTDSGNENYIGMIAGSNTGYITNSTVSVNVQSPFNIGGIVGTNDGKISGCSFQEGIITNILSKSGAVAGLAVKNGENGKILTSFVRGKQSNSNIISSKISSFGIDTSSILSSPYSASGFVYENKGSISDCYTDINLKGIISSDGGMGYKISGFVGNNGGQIRNSYSVSLLPSNRDSSSGFAESNKTEDTVGSFANCYYLTDQKNKINVDLKFYRFDGVEGLSLEEFSPNSGKFAEYAHKLTLDNNSIWFYPNGAISNDYLQYNVIGKDTVATEESIQGKVVFIGNVEQMPITFAKGRLELVNPNIQVMSRRIFDTAVINEESGDITYYYIDKDDSPIRGSMHNPRLIYNAQTMEEEILNSTSKTNLNTSHFRIISDVNYSNYEGLSNLYTVTFAGMLEGNGMTISGIGLESNKALSSGGMFACVGYSQARRGSIKNLNLEISRMNFSETTSVGGVAGVLKFGELHGISVIPSNSEGVTVLGSNFVGGIVGKAIISYEITDVYSEMSVSSAHISSIDDVYNQTTLDERLYSYAGSIAGYLGSGLLYNARSGNVNSIVGGKAGFVYGGLGRDAKVNYTFLDIKPSATIKSNIFAGFIAGEVAGSLSYAYVSDNGSDSNIFDVKARIPNAVGGITGRLAGGSITNAVNYQTINANNINHEGQFIQIVGGIAGEVNSKGALISQIYDCISTADIYARQTASGGVGKVSSALRIDGVAIKSSMINVQGQTSTPIAGGIVGENSATTTISNSYCLADIELRTNTPGIQTSAYVGGLVAKNISVLTLAYCYTTSTFDVEIFDSRAVGGVKDYSEVVGDKEASKYITFDINTGTETVTCTNVIYFGSNGKGYENQTDYILFRAKSAETLIGLVLSNYGIASRQNSQTVADTETILIAGKDTMKNIFINRYSYSGKLYYKMPDISVVRGGQASKETGYFAPKDGAAYLYAANNDAILNPRKSDFTLNDSEAIKENEFIQLKVCRDSERNIYDKLCRDKNGAETGAVDSTLYSDIKTGSAYRTDESKLIEMWDFSTWNEFTRLAIEKTQNLAWINKATLGK